MTGYTSTAFTTSVYVYMTDPCISTVITKSPAAISPPAYDLATNPLTLISTLAWTQSQSPCPAVTYKLVDYDGDPIDGSFYSQELLRTETPEYYEIDKILKTRKVGKKKEMYVSFLGWNKKFNTWITEDQIYDVPKK